MNLRSLLRYPAYLYNPKQVLIRIRREWAGSNGPSVVRLPWGHPLQVDPAEFIGHAIWTQGIHELNACEAIARLTREGDTCVDVGANIGFMTSLMTRTVGRSGHVLAFEPHPDLYARLRANIDRFSDDRSGRVVAEPVALSDAEGDDWLVFDAASFARNSGTAGLSETGFSWGEQRVGVAKRRLDPFVDGKRIALLKIDVEGMELRVLRGAEHALTERRIQAIVYEDFDWVNSGIASYLEEFGFTVFYLDGALAGPRLREVNETFHQVREHDENFLAVLDPVALGRSYRRRGWRVFAL